MADLIRGIVDDQVHARESDDFVELVTALVDFAVAGHEDPDFFPSFMVSLAFYLRLWLLLISERAIPVGPVMSCRCFQWLSLRRHGRLCGCSRGMQGRRENES